MALQDILKKIIDDAQAEIKVLEAGFETRKDQLKQEADAKIKGESAELKAKSKDAEAAVMKKVESLASRENKDALLVAKNEIINRVLTEFLSRLENADDELYGKVLDKLFLPLKNVTGRVFVSKKRLAITQKHATKDCTFFEDESVKGGFIFRGVDTEIDNSFQSLVFGEYKSNLTSYIAEQLKLV